MRVLAVNVRSGGSRDAIPRLLERISQNAPNAVAIGEYRDNPAGAALAAGLRAAGLEHQCGTQGHRGNGVLLAADRPFAAMRNPFGLSEDDYPNAIVEARFDDGLRAFAVYLPGQDRKRPHLRCLIAIAQRYNEAGIEAIAIGDFNSGRNATDIERNLGRARLADEFGTADLYEQLERHWTEAWLARHPDEREFSWYPFRTNRSAPQRGNG